MIPWVADIFDDQCIIVSHTYNPLEELQYNIKV